ncbi:hypothetical protein NPIL_211271 [Nephila pilipes]|uniref:Uncharacterized protein n=1 Tax=Nephila pilipes TaxID=299642 RepID=A0A8X6NV05_NEPPI|nr:hypothetical protein NPIL_211271 [Nephila pilipes]
MFPAGFWRLHSSLSICSCRDLLPPVVRSPKMFFKWLRFTTSDLQSDEESEDLWDWDRETRGIEEGLCSRKEIRKGIFLSTNGNASSWFFSELGIRIFFLAYPNMLM